MSTCVSATSLPLCVSCSSHVMRTPSPLTVIPRIRLTGLRGVKGSSWKKRQRGRGRMNERSGECQMDCVRLREAAEGVSPINPEVAPSPLIFTS